MQLCAENNMQVCVPSTPAQIFHLLRRQMLRAVRKPLIVMTPKSLLRHKDAVSSLDDLARGGFQTIIGETANADEIEPKKVKRVVLCSGKIYYDLLAERRDKKVADIALLRLEQPYPFPAKIFASELKRFPNAREVVWCQEEPLNQGAWFATRHHLVSGLRDGQALHVVARPASASPAVGYYAKHNAQQRNVIETALGPVSKLKASTE